MKNLNQSRRSLVVLSILIIVIALFASPATRARIAEHFEFGAATVFAANAASEAEAASVSPVSPTGAFHFLEPLASNAGNPQAFDPSLLNHITVEICEVNGGNCSVVRTFTAQGQSSERLRIATSGRDSHYIVNWDTQNSSFVNTRTYRVRVLIADLELGAIDLAPPQYNSFGRTWPIKFLVEKDPELRVRLF